MQGVELDVGRHDVEGNVDEDLRCLVDNKGVVALESYGVQADLPGAHIAIRGVHDIRRRPRRHEGDGLVHVEKGDQCGVH